MDLQQKIDRQYKKWCTLAELNATEENDRKLDKAYSRLEKMFASPAEFKAWWKVKSSAPVIVNLKK